MNRSKSLLFILVVVLALAISSIAPLAAQENVLKIWADVTRAPFFEEISAQFEEEYGVTVEVTEIGLGDGRDGLINFGPSGEGPDLVVVAHDHIGAIVANGAGVPLDREALEGDFTEAGLDLFTLNGELWGMPLNIENVAMYRNVDLVPEAPKTWEEVRAISEELQSSGASEYGFLLKSDGDTYHAFPIISAFGGYIFGLNEDGSFNVADVGLASEGGLAAAEWLAGMYADGLMLPDVGDDVMLELFGSGEAAMIVTGPWWTQRIIDTGINFAIDPIPGSEVGMEVGAPFSGGQGIVMSAYSENQLLAETFLYDFVATQDFMQAYFDNGQRPPVFVGVDTSANPNVEFFVAAGANAIPMPAIPEMGAVWGAAGNALTLISQGAEPVSTMENAVVQISEAIKLVQSEDRIVVIAGSLQAAAGCDGDWDPGCLVTQMVAGEDGIYTFTVTLPAGDYEYKVAMNGGWDENYGANGEPGGANIALSLSEETEVTFTYDDNTNIITDSVNEG